jgi:hypothetical protein
MWRDFTDEEGRRYSRAVEAEPLLGRLELLVQMLRLIAPADQPFCADCICDWILRRLVASLVGSGRRVPDPEMSAAGPDAEEFLCSDATYEAALKVFYVLLHKADPGLGHGFPGHLSGGQT